MCYSCIKERKAGVESREREDSRSLVVVVREQDGTVTVALYVVTVTYFDHEGAYAFESYHHHEEVFPITSGLLLMQPDRCSYQ